MVGCAARARRSPTSRPRSAVEPETVSKWLKAGLRHRRVVADTVVDEQWAARVGELLGKKRTCSPAGWPGSWLPRAARRVTRRSCATCAASAVRAGGGWPSDRADRDRPGEEAQADWSDRTAWGRGWGLGVLHCFGAILAWSAAGSGGSRLGRL